MKTTKLHWSQPIVSFVEDHFKTQYDKLLIHQLKGDASERQYWRIQFNGSSQILLKTQPFLKDQDPFINVQIHLKHHAVHVPKIYAVNASLGVLLIEDFGDNLLDKVVQKISINQASKYYFLALDELFKIHFDASKVNKDCLAFQLFFDSKKLNSELHFMKEYLLKKHFNISFDPDEESLLDEKLLLISKKLDQKPFYFSHRDFHSKNILIQNDKICVLDFQDARMGGCTYDLASLLKDSYIQLPNNLITELLKYYLSEKNKRESKKLSLVEFQTQFDWMCIQRNLKAMGTFGYLNVEKNKPAYLQYLKPTWGYVQENLEKFKELHPLLKLLQSKIGDLI